MSADSGHSPVMLTQARQNACAQKAKRVRAARSHVKCSADSGTEQLCQLRQANRHKIAYDLCSQSLNRPADSGRRIVP